MNIQQMMIQAQKMQREMQKALAEFRKQEFSITKNGAVTIKMLGDKSIISLEIDEDAFDKENKEMIQDLITLGINELIKEITEKEEAITEKISGAKVGLPF